MADRHGPCTKLHWGYRCTREDGHSGICHLDPEGCICGLNDPRCEGATCVLEPNELARSGADDPGLEPDTLLLTVHTDNLQALGQTVLVCNKAAARQGAPK